MRIRRIQRGFPRLDIRLVGPHPLRPLDDLPRQEEGGEDGYADVRGDEIVQIEFLGGAGEGVEPVE